MKSIPFVSYMNSEAPAGRTLHERSPAMKPVRAIIAVIVAFCQIGCSQESKMEPSSIPHLLRTDNATQLYVDNKPFLALGGELGNSNASDLDVLEIALARCQRMGLNTVMLPVYWDLIEPEEGKLDFSLVKGAIDRARHHGIRLVYLWFGTWKNSMSCYVPGWAKRDTTRFPRARDSQGQALEILTPFAAANRDTDA